MINPSYLGDGAYVHRDELERIVLTTGHHLPEKADNVIVLEPEVLSAFLKYIDAGYAALEGEKL